jgi:hypothetical protein
MEPSTTSTAAGMSAELQNLKLNFRLDDGSVQQITLADAEKQPLMALGRHHGLIRDISRVNANDLITRLRIRDTFTYMFKHGATERLAFTPVNEQTMKDLGKSMLDLTLTGNLSDPKVNDSIVDSGYTYFGQFLDHDITRDDTSTLTELQDATKINNLRTPNFDLDSVYGRGPVLSSHLYTGIKLKTGPIKTGGINGSGMITDIPRDQDGLAPLIGDNRNDENLIVQQMHLGFLCYHNAVVDALKLESPGLSDADLFAIAQREVRRHYQWATLNDFLRTICGEVTVDDILQNGVKFFKNPLNPFTGAIRMPVEFSVGAYRFGHSMIRDTYNFNNNFPNELFFNAFLFTGQGGQTSLSGSAHAFWRLNWTRFFSTDTHQAENKGRKIDTRVALHMGKLPGVPNPDTNFMAMLSSRNLLRGLALGVPTGQSVAQQMGITSLTEAQLKSNPFENTLFVPIFTGPLLSVAPKKVTSPTDPKKTIQTGTFPLLRPGFKKITIPATPEQKALHDKTVAILSANNNALCKQTPLWYYILKEAEVLEKGNRLGPVGGRIVAEVFIRMLKENSDSILNNPTWTPRFGAKNGQLRIIDILTFAGRVPVQDLPPINN